MAGRGKAIARLPAALLIAVAVFALGVTYVFSQLNGNIVSTTGTTSKATSFASSTTGAASRTTSVTNERSLGPHSIGYVGCSNTADAVAGYYLVPNKGLFWQPYSTGGGSLDLWTSPSSQYWSLFDQQVQRYGQPSKVWIEICERAVAPLNFGMVQQVFTVLKQRAPSATYYISPLNSYSPSNICALTGPNGVADAARLADEAVSNGLSLAGPVIGPLTVQNTVSDMCHPNTGGESLLGSQLATSFDG